MVLDHMIAILTGGGGGENSKPQEVESPDIYRPRLLFKYVYLYFKESCLSVCLSVHRRGSQDGESDLHRI